MRVLPLHPAHVADPGLSGQLGQPGVVRFIAITSIIIASLSMLASAGAGLMDLSLVLASATAKSIAASVTPAVPALPRVVAVVSTSPERVPANGLNYFDRQTIANGLERVRPLSDDQLSQLDELLAESGKVVMGGVSIPAPDQFGGIVTKSGHTGMRESQNSDYFELSGGRLELSASRAVFFPKGGQPAIHSSVISIPAAVFGMTPTSLRPDEVRSIVRTVNDLNGSKIRAVQARTLINMLESPGQRIVVPAMDGSDPANQITQVSTLPDGSLRIDCQNGTTTAQFLCDANGVIAPVLPAFTKTGLVNETAGIAAASTSGVQFLLAIFLLITGIMTLRRSPRGRRLHWIYVGLKLPVAITAGWFSAWMWMSLMQSTAGMAGPNTPAAPPGTTTAGAMFGIVPGLVGCIWPIMLIFLLITREVRSYYGDSGGSR